MKKLQNFRVNGIPTIFTILLLITSATSDCQLPSTWRGTWFQQDHFETTKIKIDNSSINLSVWDPDNNIINSELLGTCTKRDDDLYIFVDNISGSGNCTKCVLIKDLDTNVLNYRHTVCLDDEIEDIDTKSVKDLCTELHNADMDYYLIRDPFTPVPCPFRNEAFLFSYGKELNKDAVCPSNKSHTETCYDDTQLVFKYEACPDMNYEAKVEEIQCVGAWKDVEHKYFIATVRDSQLMRYVPGTYRCFIYNEIKDPVIASRIRPDEVVGYNVSVSISETATCAGLRNPTSGSLSLTLYAAPQDQSPCSFPAWMNTNTNVWTSLDHHFSLNGTEKGFEMLFKEIKDSRRRDDRHNLGKLTCLEAVQGDGDDVVVLAREIVGCNGQDVCISLSPKSNSISKFDLHFKDDSLTQPDFKSACLNRTLDDGTNFQNDHKGIILIEEKVKSEPCPISGGFLLSGFYKHDNKYMGKDFKSSNPMMWPPQKMLAGQGKYRDVIKFVSGDCHVGDEEEERPGRKIAVAQCLASWQDDADNTTNLILAFVTSTDNIPIHYCLSFARNTTDDYILVHASTKHCPGLNPAHNELAFYMHNCGDCVDPDEMTGSNPSLKLGSSGTSPSSSGVIIVLVFTAAFFLQ